MLTDVAAYLIACNRWDDAQEHARKALDLAREMQYHVCLAWTIQHFAAIGALSSPDDDKAPSDKSEAVARLLGYVDALIASLHVSRQYTEQQEYDRVITVLRKTLGIDEFAQLMASGADMKTDQAVEHALSLR